MYLIVNFDFSHLGLLSGNMISYHCILTFILFVCYKSRVEASSCGFNGGFFVVVVFVFLIQFYVPFKIISAHMRRANQ